MSNLVQQIREGMESIVATELPTFSELKYKFDVEKNDFRNNANRYGVVPRDITEVEGTIRSVTVDQTFELVLTTDYTNRKTDDAQMTAIEALYDSMEEVYKLVSYRKAGLSGIVLVVTLDTIEQEFFDENNVAVLRGNFIVKYRSSITV